jgi:hypothetical protein
MQTPTWSKIATVVLESMATQLPLLLLPPSTHISTRVASDVSKGMGTAAAHAAATCKHIPEQELPQSFQKAWQ